MAETEAKAEFDENQASKMMDLYSRQIASLGVDTMRNLSQLEVLVLGVRGVGVETAKNLILAGPKGVCVHDDGVVQVADLGANFYLREEHVGKVSRAEASVKQLSELNPYVNVRAHAGELDDKFVQSFGGVVVADTLPRKELVRINTLCRTRQVDGKTVPAAFVLAVTHGVSAHFFTDFGDVHLVTDADGEPTRTLAVEDLSESGVVTVASKRHQMDDGDEIKIDDITGEAPPAGKQSIAALNNLDGVKIKRIYYEYTYTDPTTKATSQRKRQQFNQFQLDLEGTKLSLDQLGKWKTGGMITAVKAKRVMNFRSLEESFQNPAQDAFSQFLGPQHPDQGLWEQGAGKTLHLAYQAVLAFQEKSGFFPRLHNEEDGNEVIKCFEELNDANKKLAAEEKPGVTVETVDKKRLKAYAWYFCTELTGYCAFLGGVAAQEVIKKFGKYTPVFQWLHSDHPQLIGNQVPSDAIPQGCRYDHQISLFGKAFQQKIANQKIFLVGCGALGCEYLKGLAMMGVATGPQGKVWCTDMDRIEVSNLSRQFLFRSQHVGKQKSVTAAASAKEMNASFDVEPLEMKVWPETEDFFDDQFWDGLDLCWNALDNVQARKYTDGKCLLHQKPLLESGTQGTKCNSEVIIPFKTRSYNDGEEQETEGIPMCTLQNFPYMIEHCIEFARSAFTGLFEGTPKSYNTFLADKKKFFEQVETAGGKEGLKILQDVRALVDAQAGGVTFEKCIALAFSEFVEQYVTRIKNLIHWFPEDERVVDPKTKEDLGAFWTGHKRFPLVPKFSLDEKDHFEYLYAAGNLYAVAFGLEPVRDRAAFKQAAERAQLKVPAWKPPTSGKVKVDEDEAVEEKKAEETSTEEDDQIAELTKLLQGLDAGKLQQLVVADFEKDDDTNFHIDFISISANMRATNYRIKQASRHKCKIIAGKIIAALATTTAMITGLVELEFYKLLLNLGYIQEDAFYNANINLGVAQFQFFQPDAAIRHERREEQDPATMMTDTIVPFPDKWTTWDHVVVDEGSLTVQEFQDAFPKLFRGITVQLLHKRGKMKEGRVLINANQRPRNANFAKQMLAKPSTSDALRAKFQKEVDEAAEYNAKLTQGKNRKLIDLYVELYGPLVSDKRNYVLLDGAFEDADGHVAELPAIKYIFKR